MTKGQKEKRKKKGKAMRSERLKNQESVIVLHMYG